MATSVSGGRSQEYPDRITDHGQATGKLNHLRMRVECTLFCNLQSRARTHAAVLDIAGYIQQISIVIHGLVDCISPLPSSTQFLTMTIFY